MKYKATLFPILITAMSAALYLGATAPVHGQDRNDLREVILWPAWI